MKLKILNIEAATGKTGNKYYKVQTNKGDMTAFDAPIVDELMAAWRDKKEINLNCVPSPDGKYMNIRGFAMDDEAVEQAGEKEREREEALYPAHIKPQEFGKTIPINSNIPERKTVKGSAYEKDPVGLAVEVFNALIIPEGNPLACKDRLEESMIVAIELVKQAQKAFS